MITDQKWFQKANVDSAGSTETDLRHFFIDDHLTNWPDDWVTIDRVSPFGKKRVEHAK